MDLTMPRSVNAPDSCVQRLLDIAVKEGCVEKVSQLLNQGADVNRMYRGQTPLHVASKGTGPNDELPPNFLEVVKILVEAGADVNRVDEERNMTPLMIACENDQSEIGSYLLKMGAEVNAHDFTGPTSVLHAIGIGMDPSFISDLVKAGASVKCSEINGGPLHAILSSRNTYCDHEKWDILERLLSYPCDIDAKNQSGGFTPLHIAVDFDDLKSARMLIRAGCKMDIEDDSGHTPLSCAVCNEQYDHVELLLAAGGRIPHRNIRYWMALQRQLDGEDPSMLEDVDPRMLEQLVAMGAECPKLVVMCRRTFFDHYGTEAQNCIQKLPLPPLIKSFLSYEIL